MFGSAALEWNWREEEAGEEGRDGGDGRAAPPPPLSLPSVSVTAPDAALIEMLRNGNHGSTREVARPPASPSSLAPEHILERPFQSQHRGDQTVSVVSLNQVVDLSTRSTQVSAYKAYLYRLRIGLLWLLSQLLFDYSTGRPRGRNSCCEGKGCPCLPCVPSDPP